MVSNVSGRATAAPADMSGLRAFIAAVVPGLRPSDAKVMRLVLEDPGFVRSATTDETADRAGVSPATVVRAARAAGFDGFGDLKLALTRAGDREPGMAPPERLSGDSTAREICATVLASHADSIRSARATLDPEALDRAVALLTSAREILVIGVGTSAAPASDAAYRWTTIGCRAQAPPDTRMAAMKARLLSDDDVLVAISHTGHSAETLTAAEAAAAAGATIIAITSFAASPLADRADVNLLAGGPDLGLHMAAASSRLAHLAIIDILHAAIALTDLPRTHHALQTTAALTEPSPGN